MSRRLTFTGEVIHKITWLLIPLVAVLIVINVFSSALANFFAWFDERTIDVSRWCSRFAVKRDLYLYNHHCKGEDDGKD